jgi:hypothetical protein
MTTIDFEPLTVVVPLWEDPPGVFPIGKSRVLLELVTRAFQQGETPEGIRTVVWNHEPGGNVEHIAEHALTPAEVEAVICDPMEKTASRTTGRPVITGYTPDGRLVLVIYEEVDEIAVYPVTAYEIEG